MIWLDALQEVTAKTEPAVLVTLVEAEGSVPRGPGAKMVVTAQGSFDTIGGGALEYVAIQRARDLLGTAQAALDSQPLGPALGQCCGGRAELLYEPIVASDLGWIGDLAGGLAKAPLLRRLTITDQGVEKALLNGAAAAEGRTELRQEEGARVVLDRCHDPRQSLFLFGAGHVGKALVAALAALPFRVIWIDGREEEFPQLLPANATKVVSDPPHFVVDRAPAGTFFLVMTHSHPLDQAICEAVLKRGDQGYLGLIGSKSKKTQFLRRLAARDLDEATLKKLSCPIGLPGIMGKEPAVIAASVAADLLGRIEEAAHG